MATLRDFQAYHRSISAELIATKDRVRQLIGDRHWATDGQYKEILLRRILSTHLAESARVGTGFVCCAEDTTHQTDILLTFRDKPTLFRSGELIIVTPDSAIAIIEVKTSLESRLENDLHTLANDIELIRVSGNRRCQAGFFIYGDEGSIPHERVLAALHAAADGRQNRVINWMAVGSNAFIRFWTTGGRAGRPTPGGEWRSYDLEGLAHAYFINNVIWDTCQERGLALRLAWFPIPGGGKELFAKMRVRLDDPEVKPVLPRRAWRADDE